MKSSLKQKSTATGRGFTLIELLVVIAIIALLAGIALPAYQGVMFNAQQAAASEKVKQIVIGLRTYAMDNGGAFPSNETSGSAPLQTSNDAFRLIVPTYLDTEAVFVVGRSRYGAKADDKVEPSSEILKAGENHFSYVMGLTDTSKSRWPLVSDGSDGNGTFSSDEGKPAGTWKGRKGLVGNVDGSVHMVGMRGPAEARYIPRFDDNTKNALAVREYMGQEVSLLDPAK